MTRSSRERQAEILAQVKSTDGPCKIKCCGMFREQDISAVNSAKPDFCGFIVDFPKSHRNLDPERATQLAELVDDRIATVAVTVDMPVERAAKLLNDGSFDLIQLHGNETPEQIEKLHELTSSSIIKAFQIESEEDIEKAELSPADMVLLDCGQGSGKKFDWSLARKMKRPFLLAGGLTPENIGEAIEELRPWGVDISSGLETKGLKDPEKIQAAVAEVRRKK